MANTKGRTLSSEHKQKISKSLKRQGIVPPSRKGINLSEETKQKISKANRGRKPYEMTEKIKEKISRSLKGNCPSEEIRKKLRGRIGEKSPHWKGGVSKIDRLCRRMREYLQWRSDIFVRDNWTCQTCKNKGIYVTAHHKKSFSKIIRENNITDVSIARQCEELWDINNGVTLCENCHELTDNYKRHNKRKAG